MQGQAEKKVITGNLVKQAKNNTGNRAWSTKQCGRRCVELPRRGAGVLIVLTKTRNNWSRRMEAGAPFQAFSQNGELLRFQLVAV